MKKLLNDPRHVVREMLEGLADLTPGQALLEAEDVIIRAGGKTSGVAVLSGGGAGHEPAHAGYVGEGMLHAAISGDVFTSPSTDAVLAAIRAVGGPDGVVLVVKNYTGDRLNFGLAAELARAEGIPAEIVVVADDVSLRDTVEPARRRGIAGTVLVHKVAGAAAAAGLPLAQVAEAARAAAAMGTMGVALGACTVPAAGRPGFTLGDDEAELGLGIHGEQGVKRIKLQSADALVEQILGAIIEDRGIGRGDRVALLVNGLGGTPLMELAVVARRAVAVLREAGIAVARAWIGNLLTALEMPGMSLTLLPVDDARLALLDAPSAAPAWPGAGRIAERQVVPAPASPPAQPARARSPAGQVVRQAALRVAAALEAAEAQLTELDSATGDGDLGISMARGAAAIRALPDSAWADAPTALQRMSEALRRAIGGSSGPFYATGLLRAARALPGGEPEPANWAAAFQAAVAAVSELGGAKPGDRTMLDALYPAAEHFAAALASGVAPGAAWAEAVAQGEAGARATESMAPRLGRAAYLGDRAKGHPDAGAAAVAIWLSALRA